MTEIVHEFRIYCTGKGGSHSGAPRWLGAVTVTDLGDDEFRVEIDRATETAKFKVVNGTVYMKCRSCPYDVKEEMLNLGRAVIKLGEGLGVSDLDLPVLVRALDLYS